MQILVDANTNWPEKFPFREDFFNRFDETPDSAFYTEPRYVTHIDDRAIASLTKYYDTQFPKDAAARQEMAVLDMCSSWISHYPKGFTAGRVAGVVACVQFEDTVSQLCTCSEGLLYVHCWHPAQPG